MTGQTVGGLKGGSTEQGPHTGSLCCDEAAAILTRNLLGCGVALKRKVNVELNSSCEEQRKRHYTPSQEKVEGYREKRRKNNEAAKRSREKRRANDTVLEMRVLSLLEENARLRAELLAVKFRFGLVTDFSGVSILRLTRANQPDSDEPSSQLPQQDATCQKPHSLSDDVKVSNSRHLNMLLDPSCPGPSTRLVEEQQAYSSRPLWPHANTQHSPDAFRRLPHKLRFKAPSPLCGGRTGRPVATVGPNVLRRTHQPATWRVSDDSREKAYASGDQHYHNPSSLGSTEDSSLRSQISCLSQEVAGLKQLFCQQQLSKNVGTPTP
ncbi:uncharacterized protein [Nerophis lumbriciformis]|uniref:uncharacterized protein n=1 Tax=Nerophis lumbriciformis TaxID=546530 RepID=UPI002AE05B8E|nr:uncharacterized protein LOC133624330 [Nerophis lumbriciformis]